jgi:hypothetical protein
LQEIDVALQAACPLVEAGGFRAILYPGDILRQRQIKTDDAPA